MLWSLGLAALAGVCAAFWGVSETWRFIGTALMTSVAAGLMLAVGRLIDREKTREAGLVGMAAITVEYILGVLLLWEASLPSDFRDGIGYTMLAALQVAPPVMAFLALKKGKANSVARWIGLIATAVAFVLMMVAAWVTQGFLDKWWLSSAAVEVCGAVAALCVLGVPLSGWNWRWPGIIAAFVSMVLSLIGIWSNPQGSWIFAAIAGVAAVVAHANISLLCPLRPSQKWVRFVTIVAVVAAALLIDAIVYRDLSMQDPLERPLTAAGVVAGCGTLALAVFARMNLRLQPESPTPDLLTTLTLECPHCALKQKLPAGDSACQRCGLRFHIRLEEPRCGGCGYLLYMLKSDRCPECGLPVQLGAPAAPA